MFDIELPRKPETVIAIPELVPAPNGNTSVPKKRRRIVLEVIGIFCVAYAGMYWWLRSSGAIYSETTYRNSRFSDPEGTPSKTHVIRTDMASETIRSTVETAFAPAIAAEHFVFRYVPGGSQLLWKLPIAQRHASVF